MVKIKAIKAYRPKDPKLFTIPPYDVIDEETEKELKKNPYSSIHVILPDGKGEEIYINAENELNRLIKEELISREENPSIYVYRQQSMQFRQEGLIMGVSVKDYETGNIKKHEHTREKPLRDRIAHMNATEMNTGLVWNTYKWDNSIQKLLEKIKNSKPIVNFEKYGYRNILWKTDDEKIINELHDAFENKILYIADGHHRAAAAAAYKKKMIKENKGIITGKEKWNNFLVYAASDHQVRILPYNRVIKKLIQDKDNFLNRIRNRFEIEKMINEFLPEKEHEIGMFLENNWYKLNPKKTDFKNPADCLDASILQNFLLEPILGIQNVRKDQNIFFVGGITDPNQMKKYVTEKGNAIFFSLYPIQISQIEEIADNNGFMPPKSTWFDPKLLTGLIFNPLF
ncbi:MAG: DUF1015 domain-containing protein [archaeon]|nr:DUF1015 domain-containing protein [archaeon]